MNAYDKVLNEELEKKNNDLTEKINELEETNKNKRNGWTNEKTSIMKIA